MPAPAPDTSAWLVATKLHPPLVRSDTIRRPRLEQELSRSVATLPLTLLSAPAGYGKTTMLAALPHLMPDHGLVWISLDSEDNDPIRFIGLLAAACQRLHPEAGKSVWPWLAGGAAAGTALKRAVGALINDILTYLPDPFIMVLDDLHFVTEPAVYVALEFLLDHQPPQLHLAVGTRHDPPLRLARLAARRQLAELRRPDLGFSPDEAHQLLNETLGLSLSDSEVAALQERTEGWPAGLCLLAGPLGRLATQAGRSQFMAAVTHTERYALDFLAEEVLRNLPDDLRLFLVQTSVLAEMTPTACRAVTGRVDAAEVLDALYHQNLTIAAITTEPDGEPVYRHHALFARLLARLREREIPGEVAELHRRAAQAQKTPGRAIAHYIAAGLWEEAAELMIRSGMEMLHRGMFETVRSWYGALPEETRAGHPRLAVVTARCEIHRGDFDAANALLHQAREAFVAAGDLEGEGDALASLITVAYQNNDPAAAAALAERALQLPLAPLGAVAARLGRAWVHLSAGRWESISADVAEALAIPHATGDRRADLIGITYMSAPLAAVPGCMAVTERYAAEAGARAVPDTAWRLGADELHAWPLLWQGRVGEALAHAEAAESLRERLGGYPFVGPDTAAVLAVLYVARGDLDGAARAAEALIQRYERASVAKWAFYLHGAARAMALLGRHQEARTLHDRLAALHDDSPLTQYLTAHLAGLLALLEGRPAGAAAPLARAARMEEQLPIAHVGGSARLLQARLALDQGRPDEALAIAARVAGEWEQAGTPGCILLDGPAVLPVLRLGAQRGLEAAARLLRLFPEGAQAPLAPAPASVSAAAAAPATGGPAPLAEPLTQREQEVLRLIGAGRTNRQIGEELYITEETVKTHVVHILRKLDVTSRTQAAVRAHELGL